MCVDGSSLTSLSKLKELLTELPERFNDKHISLKMVDNDEISSTQSEHFMNQLTKILNEQNYHKSDFVFKKLTI